MSPVEKKAVIAIINKHYGSYTVDCCKELSEKSHIPYKDMQNIRVCVERAAGYPAQLDKEAPDLREGATPAESEVLAAKAATTHITAGLATFELKPKGLTGETLLANLMTKQNISLSSKTMLAPSRHLDVEVSDGQQS